MRTEYVFVTTARAVFVAHTSDISFFEVRFVKQTLNRHSSRGRYYFIYSSSVWNTAEAVENSLRRGSVCDLVETKTLSFRRPIV